MNIIDSWLPLLLWRASCVLMLVLPALAYCWVRAGWAWKTVVPPVAWWVIGMWLVTLTEQWIGIVIGMGLFVLGFAWLYLAERAEVRAPWRQRSNHLHLIKGADQ